MHGLGNVTPKNTEVAPGALPARARFGAAAAWLGLAALLSLTVLAYAPVLFDFFAGDDFVHLSWLSQAVNHPELLWRNFHSSWLDGTTTKFYRPLISVFMYTDYLIGGANGFCFHLTNLIFHLLSTVFLFLAVRQMGLGFVSGSEPAGGKGETVNRVEARALIAAAVFALYPLHPEAVSWITGRVDSVVTTFCLASVWCYMQWRARGGAGWLIATLFSSCLGLLSKEMAITLPAVFLCRELFLAGGKPADKGPSPAEPTALSSDRGSLSPLKAFVSFVLAAVLPTLPFWGLLGVYFVVRRFALGTFVGGYDNSLFFIANFREFLLTWLHGLRMFVEPINRMLLGTKEPLTRAWDVCLVVSAVSLPFAFALSAACRRQMLFTFSWLALSLLPVYKIFAIADDLQGSRLAYLATAPLAVLFAFACVSWQTRPLSRRLGIALGVILTCLCFVLLGINNQPWVASGKEANSIRAGLDNLYGKEISGDPQVLFIGLPDQINGAYTCRNSLDGMTRRPQLHRDIKNCLMINPFEPIFPFGYLKDSMAAQRQNILVYRWDAAARRFAQVPIPAPSAPALPDRNLKTSAIRPCADRPAQVMQNADGSVEIITGRQSGQVEVVCEEQNCWSADFVQADIVVHQASKAPRAGLELLYANELSPGFELKRRAHADFDATASRQTLTFALRGLPQWSFGGKFAKFLLLIPADTKLQLSALRLAPASSLGPGRACPDSGDAGSKGFLHLGPSQKVQRLQVDCAAIPGAVSCELEITRVNLLFEEQNGRLDSAVQWRKIPLNSVGGSFELRYDQGSSGRELPLTLSAPGIYEVRLRALAKDKSLVGVVSDHIVISVDTQ